MLTLKNKFCFEIINSQIYPLLKKDIKLPKLIFDVDNKSIPPKWLISAIEKQLEQIGQIDKLDEVLKEMIEIKMQIGNPSFTTPISQIIEDSNFKHSYMR